MRGSSIAGQHPSLEPTATPEPGTLPWTGRLQTDLPAQVGRVVSSPACFMSILLLICRGAILQRGVSPGAVGSGACNDGRPARFFVGGGVSKDPPRELLRPWIAALPERTLCDVRVWW